MRPLKYGEVSSLNLAAVGLADAFTDWASLRPQVAHAVVQAEGGDVRWRDDGIHPTATVGMLLKENVLETLDASHGILDRVRFIAATGAAATKVKISLYGDNHLAE
jgi:hypothetical protein